jgi:hypothetical protein
MGHYENAELVHLFEVYTSAPDSIGAHFASAAMEGCSADPLLVATGTDLAFFPGGGRPPTVESYRLSARGFKEISAVSHLGPALATLARMKRDDPRGGWRHDADRLLAAVTAVRRTGSPELWDQIAVPAFLGRSESIAAMIDYACQVTERVLERALADPAYLDADRLRVDFLAGPADDLPVPFNRIMVATFFLTGLDISHRFLTWFDGLDVPWERTMAVVAGRAGRPTAGVTRESNSVANVILTASRGRLDEGRLLIAPHAPVFAPYDGSDVSGAAALEDDYRSLWSRVIATTELGGEMFAGHPRFAPLSQHDLVLTPGTTEVHEMPAVSGPDDWAALVTRLRVVLEDPRQLLSGAVTDYASEQLVKHDNRPQDVVVPGLDHEPYPALHTTGASLP